MAGEEIELRPISHITIDAIGAPGKRVFYLQGWQGTRSVTLIVEKIQIQTLAIGLEQFMTEVEQQFPELTDVNEDYIEDRMRIQPPVDPLFRVGELGLGYDAENDLVVLVAREAVAEDQDPAQAKAVRFWCSRAQVRVMCRWGMQVASKGRPICPQCGEPMDPEGHFCPKKNGHKH
jgi:uncharacterized repeat protein (TIGR03847 family)